jgi:hypothetical protein
MRKIIFHLIILQIIALSFKAEGQDFTYGFVVGDTAQLIYEDTLSFNIQWQERNHTASSWKNIQNATSAILEFVYLNAIDSQKLYRAKITYNGDPCIYYSKQINHRITNKLSELHPANHYQGGLLFYNDDSMGLVFAPFKNGKTDPSFYGNHAYTSFGCLNIAIPAARNTKFGSGKTNTKEILMKCGNQANAAYVCDTLNLNGFDDWFLPSKGELDRIYEIQKNPNTPIVTDEKYLLSILYHWSSSELDSEQAYYNNSFTRKSKDFWVRAARQFIRTKPFKLTYKINPPLSLNPYDIYVEQSKTAPSNVIVKFIGEQELSDKLVLDFGQGKVLSGSGAGPYEVYYNYEGFNQITAVLNSGNCQKNQFISRYFKVQLFHELKQNFFTNYKGNIKMADYDKDGFKDMLVTGFDSSSLYRYMGNDTFELVNIQLPRLSLSSAIWVDFNNDGWNDFILSGYQSKDSTCRSFVYKNNKGNFELMNINIPGIKEGYIESIDLDQNGIHEIILGGEGNGNTIINKMYSVLNEEFIELPNNLASLKNSSCDVRDCDKDGDADVLLTGHDGTKRNTLLYRNDNGNLVETGMHFTDVDNGCAKFGDYDNDGWPDIAITGNRTEISVTYPGGILSVDARPAATLDIFKNQQGNNFVKQISYEKWVTYVFSTLGWGDYDNDGDLDILILGVPGMQWAVGGTGGGTPSVIYRSAPRIMRNDGQDNFISIDAYLPADFSDIITIEGYQLAEEEQFKPTWVPRNWQGKDISFTDYNNDGKLDVIREGHYEQANKMYKNCNLYYNLAPSIPEHLLTKTGCNKVKFSWKESSDDHSPTNTLFYEIYVGSNPGASDVASIHNCNYIQNNFYNLNLKPGTYYWSVKAVDQAQTASAWAPEQSFTISGKPSTPVVTIIGNTLHSSVQSGNQWHDLNGPISGATAQEYIPTLNGTYYSLVTDHLCTSDTSNKVEVIVTGITNSSGHSAFNIMPNPANKYLNVSSPFASQNVSYKITDIHGREILAGFFHGKIAIQIESLSNGTYFLNLTCEKLQEVHKFIKQ